MANYVDILAVEHWPGVFNHGEQNLTWNGKRKAISEDGKYWLVKKNGLFQKWEWRPVNGMFVKLQEILPQV